MNVCRGEVVERVRRLRPGEIDVEDGGREGQGRHRLVQRKEGSPERCRARSRCARQGRSRWRVLLCVREDSPEFKGFGRGWHAAGEDHEREKKRHAQSRHTKRSFGRSR